MFSIAYRKPAAALAAFLLIVGVTEARNPRGGATSSALQITTTSPLTSATQSTAYTSGSPLQTMAASGGTSPYTWTLTSQSGGSNTWAVTSGGAITGTPTAAETDTLNIKVVDSAGSPATVGPTAFTLVVNASGGQPAAPAELIDTQGGGSSVCNNNFGTGCSTSTSILVWPASSGATYYTIERNGSALGSGGCSGNQTGLTCTDATATNLNRVNTYGDETTYAYAVKACNGSGCSSATTGAHWMYHGQAYNSCSNFSGGGFGSYMGTTPVANFTNGSNIMTVTNAGTWTIFQYSSVQDASSVIPTTAGTGGLGNAYILPYGTSGTTGAGGTGTYALSTNATGNATGDVIDSNPGSLISQNGMESCPVTGTTELGHTYAMTFNWPATGAYVQQVTASPGAVTYDLNIGDTTYSRVDVYTTSFSHGLNYTIHSRPGANISGSGDIYSSRFVELFNQSGVSSYGTPVTNAWFTLLVPNTVLGLGTGQFTGYVTANWHGFMTMSGGTSATLVSTTDGSYTNIASGHYLMVHTSQGWTCIAATGTASGPTGTVSVNGGCASGIGVPSGTNMEVYDAQVCASSASVSPGPDNGGLIQGNGEPDATYFGGGIIGFGNSYGANPNGVGTCTGTGNGHWGLFNGNSATITTQGSSGSPLTNWVSRRTSIYKPEFQQEGGSGYQTYFIDMVGWQ